MKTNIDINNNSGFFSVIKPWSMFTTMVLPAGTYTFTVASRKLGGQNFYAGGNATSGAAAAKFYEGWLIITIIPR